MLPTIQIKDNFLDEKEFKILTNNIDKITYAPMTNPDNYGFRHHFEISPKNAWFFTKIKKQFFPEVNLKVTESSYHLRHNTKKVLSHYDEADYNFILYLVGEELVYNGTGFYYKNKLNTYLGFDENRALFFDEEKITFIQIYKH